MIRQQPDTRPVPNRPDMGSFATIMVEMYDKLTTLPHRELEYRVRMSDSGLYIAGRHRNLTVYNRITCTGFTIKHEKDGDTDIHIWDTNPFKFERDASLPQLMIINDKLGIKSGVNGDIVTTDIPKSLNLSALIDILQSCCPHLGFLDDIKDAPVDKMDNGVMMYHPGSVNPFHCCDK